MIIHPFLTSLAVVSYLKWFLSDILINLSFADVNRWQDGAIVANNPTVFAIREAQLLWPDARVDCLVSVGCGSVPTKVPTDPLLVPDGPLCWCLNVTRKCLDLYHV